MTSDPTTHSVDTSVHAVCFYLPQFHPIPENDKWWGKGFTEWTNVTRAEPIFRGHYQPHRPADLGFYDLRLPEVQRAQAELAAQYGLHGFCYYHYWFNGRRLLEGPLNALLRSGEPARPFCICWANENWTRRWDGLEAEVLMAQHYSPEDDLAHVRALAETLADPRYIRVNGKPLLLVYRASALPNPCQTADIWRREALRLGIGDLYLCRVESSKSEFGAPHEIGFDDAVEFQPRFSELPSPLQEERTLRLLCRLGMKSPFYPPSARVHDYGEVVRTMKALAQPTYPRFPGVAPGWDNTARRGQRATVLTGSTPELYKDWLDEACRRARARPTGERLVFINAWNEWAEGAHLEPDQRYGHRYLEVTRDVLRSGASSRREVSCV